MRRKSCPKLDARKRRGALLLVVLSVLIVFLMLGTVLVTHATRSRTAATTFATAGIASNKDAILTRQALDEALMQLIRGRTGSSQESILDDRYSGDAISYTAEAIEVTGPLIKVTMPATNVAHYLDLNGRVLTFVPDDFDASSMSSYRILRTELQADDDGNPTGNLTLYVANIRPHPSAVPPPAPCGILINPHDFREEPYDSFATDSWLTQYTLGGSDASAPPVVQVVRPSLAVSGTATVDNDGDGILDGVWLEDFLSPNETMSFDVSYLVYELDSRLNVNAHGSADRIGYTSASWGSAPTDVEPGFGWGVADIDLSKLFVTDPHAFDRLLGGYSYTSAFNEERNYAQPAADSVRARPLLPTSDGRYGLALKPAPGGTQSGTAASSYEMAVYGEDNSIDLSAMMKVFVTSGSAPTLEYRVPEGYSVDLVHDPYDARLDDDAPRLSAYSGSGTASASDNNLFTLGELERVLRQFDPDANALPQRLAGLLGAEAGPTRMLITTDSWDTPMLTGTTATIINSYAKTLQMPYDVLSPDISAGLKFDVNRPFDDTSPASLAKSKSEFCKHLYSLLIAITDSASSPPDKKELAQWAVNVLDYRDHDSNITAFTFDTNITDGWGPETDGWDPEQNTVFGNERPDLIIGQTLAWWSNDSPHGELFVTLYRPPVPLITDEANPQNSVPIAPLDSALADDSDPTKLDLAKTVPNATTGVIHPIWRIRYQAQDEDPFYIRFDPLAPNQTLSEPFNPGNTSYPTSGDQTTHLLPADGFICIRPHASSPEHVTVDADIAYTVSGGKELRFNSANSANGAKVHLERLANPSIAFNDDRTSAEYNPYVSVNSFPAKSVSRNGEGNSANWISYVRSDPFWKTPTQFETNVENPPVLTKLSLQNRGDFPWPNRPFISHVELALVPPGNAGGVMDSVLIPGVQPYHYLSLPDVLGDSTVIKRLLDATHVPSRFLGSSLTVDQLQAPNPPSLSPIGMASIPYRQLSRYREPGKMNINTMPETHYASNAPWRALLGDSAVTLSGTSRFLENPATSFGDVLDLKKTGEIFVDVIADSGSEPNGNSNGNNNADATSPSPHELFPMLGYRTAIRLGNTATIRSNVFAVWVTVKITDSTKTEPTFHRLFAIVDRTVPTAFQKGKDLNAKDVIRLRRYLY